MWKYAKSGIKGNCELFNVNIFDYDWEDTNQTIDALNPENNQRHEMAVYKADIGDKIVIFAAGEYSNRLYRFYLNRPIISIDFRNCVSINEIRNLLKENLSLSEWDDKKPDDLFQAIKKLNPCEIYIIGANLIPNNISGYMKYVIDVFNKIEELYNNLVIYVMDVVTIDFSGVKDSYDAHKLISKALDFPDWYGMGLDALWDLLTGYIPSYEIHLKGVKGEDGQIYPYLQKIVGIFQESETEGNDHKIIIES